MADPKHREIAESVFDRNQRREAEINEARSHPSIDNLQIVALKRRKLLVKDEIARLQQVSALH